MTIEQQAKIGESKGKLAAHLRWVGNGMIDVSKRLDKDAVYQTTLNSDLKVDLDLALEQIGRATALQEDALAIINALAKGK